MYPAQIDKLSIRYFFRALLWAAQEKRDETDFAWQRSLAIATAVLKWGGGSSIKDNVPLTYVYDQTIGDAGKQRRQKQIGGAELEREFELAKLRSRDRAQRNGIRNRQTS